MIPRRLSIPDLEAASDLLAEALDEVGEAREAAFLAKLALALANLLGDNAALREAIAAAKRDLG